MDAFGTEFHAHKSEKTNDSLKEKKAWDLAWSGLKSIPVNMFMMWMAGDSVQIFSILITFMMFFSSFKALISTPTGIFILF